MTVSQINNPDGALKQVSDWRTMKDDSGEALDQGTTKTFRAGASLAPGSVVVLVGASAAGTPPHVLGKATAHHYSSVVGVTNSAATVAAGELVEVVTEGLAFVRVGAGTPAVNNTASVQANSHEAGVVTGTADATTIVGSVLGVYLGAKDSDNRAPVFVNRQ